MHVASADLDTNTSGRFLLEPSAADPTRSSCIHPDSRLPYKMLASRPQLPCQRTFSPRSISISIRPLPPVQSLRRDLLAGLAGVSLLLAQDASALDLSNLNSSSAATASDTGSFISITPINKKAKDFMDMRDDAMEYQCKGGMFDCDGDRRDFAHKQYKEWLDAGGVPKRIRDGKPEGPRAF